MKNLQICKICESETKLRYVLEFDYLLMSKLQERQEIFRCKNCQSMETFPRYNNRELEKYYSTEYSTAVSKKNILRYLQQIKYTFDFRKIMKHTSNKKIKIFDFGAGYGEFLAFLQERNIEVFGLEPTKLARDFVFQKLGVKLFPETAENFNFSEKYDVVIMRHVLEHVSDPQKVLNEIFENGLGHNSICMIKVPNGNSLERKIFGRYWSCLDIPRHRFHFSKKSLRFMLKKAGFTNVVINSEMVPMDLARTVSSWLRNKIMPKRQKFINPQILDALLIIILAPLSAILSIFGASRLIVVAQKNEGKKIL